MSLKVLKIQFALCLRNVENLKVSVFKLKLLLLLNNNQNINALY